MSDHHLPRAQAATAADLESLPRCWDKDTSPGRAQAQGHNFCAELWEGAALLQDIGVRWVRKEVHPENLHGLLSAKLPWMELEEGKERGLGAKEKAWCGGQQDQLGGELPSVGDP